MISSLEDEARIIRGMILDQVFAHKNGHIASAFSVVEILLALYYRAPILIGVDKLILSKGHGVSALHAILSRLYRFGGDCLTSPQNGNLLGGHPDVKVPGIDWSTGSLGHGLSVAAGMALAARMDNKPHQIFCILGDGELQEGSIWEAAMFASHHNLGNLTAIVDYNQHQSCGEVNKILTLTPIIGKWASFGWFPIGADGHSFNDLEMALSKRGGGGSSPNVIIAHTEKGHGVSFIETGDKWHTQIPNETEMVEAKNELGLIL